MYDCMCVTMCAACKQLLLLANVFMNIVCMCDICVYVSINLSTHINIIL